MNRSLFIIPARGGSKGIPQKNIRMLADKPLIYYSIDIARQLTADENICVSTDDLQIRKVVEDYGLKVPFIRPTKLATDNSGSNEVLLHAVKYYEYKGVFFNSIVLLQPTSPIRKVHHVKEAISLFSNSIDMVVSVKKSNAASVLCKEENGFIVPVLNSMGSRRQDFQDFYEYNGSIYVINIQSLKEKGLTNFSKEIKYTMPPEYSIDIDTLFDWEIAEFLIQKYLPL